jgi:hemerythrin
MHIEWHDGLSVGVVEIDNQHKELIRRKNVLDAAIAQGKGAEELIKLCRFLEFYIVAHFELEEFFMNQFGYYGYRTHKDVHRDFIGRFFTFKAQLERQGSTDELVRQVGDFIADWLSKHILHEDQEFGVFLKSRLGKTAAATGAGISLNASMVGYDKVYHAGARGEDAVMMKIVDGILDDGQHRVELSQGEQTAWLKVPEHKACRIRLAGGSGGYAIMTEAGSMLHHAGGSDFDLPSTSFRIIAEEDGQQFTITIGA